MGVAQWTQQAVADRLRNLFGDDAPSPGEALIASAAVLASFDIDTLKPSAEPTDAPPADPAAARKALEACSEPVPTLNQRPRRALTREARRRALRRLIDKNAIDAALMANPDRERGAVQDMLEAVLRNPAQLPPLMSPEEVRAYQIVLDWLAGLVEGLPDQQTLQNLAERAILLAPFHALVGEYFAGRERELQILGDYVGVLAPSGTFETARRFVRSVFSIVTEPPLYVFGPGGIGKSTLVAKFILDHVVDDPRLPQFPFTYLDLDRPGLVAEEPITLLIESLRQLSSQYPSSRAQLAALQREWSDRIGQSATPPTRPYAQPDRVDQRDTEAPKIQAPEAQARETQARETQAPGDAASATSALASQKIPEETTEVKRFEPIWSTLRLGERDFYIETFASAVHGLQTGQQPMLFVIDTFEEVQLRSAAHVSELFAFLERLQGQIPFLRTVLCGRVVPAGYTVKELELKTFDLEAATAYLTARVKIDQETAATVARQVTGSPLALTLAVDLLRKEQSVPGGLSDLDALLGELRKGNIEAQLYTRVLRHIVDPEVRKLAHPGLVLRRITPEIIQKVLAGPCGLAVPDLPAAERLFQKIQREVVLVTTRSPDVLVHRPELRAVMLQPLRDAEGEHVKKIHEAAVHYYETQPPDPELRAEEIYHRLSLDFDRPALERRWMEGMDRFLVNAPPELSPRAQGFLAARLPFTLLPASWPEVDAEDWERYATREVREYLRVGRLDDAVALLAQRPDVTSAELQLLYVEALARTGSLAPAGEEPVEDESNLGATHRYAEVRFKVEAERRRAVSAALADAFSHVDRLLDMLTRFGLSELIGQLPPLTELPAGRESATLAVIIASLATARYELGPLILAARRTKPDNAALWSVADSLGVLARGLSDVSAIQNSVLTHRQLGEIRTALTRLEAQTCRVALDPLKAFNTGFLVGPDLVLTNVSMVRQAGVPLPVDEELASRLVITFDDWTTDTDVAMSGIEVPLASRGGIVALSRPPEMDGTGLGYVLLRLATPIGNAPGPVDNRRGWMTLQPEVTVESKTAVSMFRFDSRRALIFSLSPTGMRERYEKNGRLRYEIEGEPGGSGGPVFDDQLRLIALHYARVGGSFFGGLTGRRLREGIPTDVILKDLGSRGITLPGPATGAGNLTDVPA